MKTTITTLALILAFAGSAAAQGESDEAYQNLLRGRALSPSDKELCVAKTGDSSGAAFEACRITRLFLSDIDAKREKGFPPLTDIKYTVDKIERGKIMDRM